MPTKFFRLLLSSFILLSLLGESKGQEFLFSQPFASPMSVDPSLLGLHNGLYRVGGQYRSQWFNNIDKGFTAFQASVDARIRPFKRNQRDYFGLGFSFANSREGNLPLSTFKFYGGLSYHKSLDRNMRSTISTGFSFGSIQAGYDYSNLLFEDQFNNGGFTDPTSEAQLLQNTTFGDVSFGLNYKFDDEKFLWSVGLSIQHINEPKRSYFDDALTTYAILPRTFIVYGIGRLPVSLSGSMLNPKFIFRSQGSFYSANGSLTYSIPLKGVGFDNLHFGVGAEVGNSFQSSFNLQKISPLVGIEMQPFTVGINYDISMQPISTFGDYGGGLEISFIYIGSQEDPKKIQGFIF